MSQTIGGFGLKGSAALVIAIAAIAGLAYYAGRFTAIIAGAAVAAVIILHFWNKRPVKRQEDEVRLNLDKEP